MRGYVLTNSWPITNCPRPVNLRRTFFYAWAVDVDSRIGEDKVNPFPSRDSHEIVPAIIDDGCEDGRFPLYASCVAISTPGRLAFQQLNMGWSWNEKLKIALSWMSSICQKAIGGIYVTEKWRADTLQPGSEFDKFKPRHESCIFKCISWLNGSFSGGWWSGFSEKDLSNNGTNVASYLANVFFFLSSHINGLWCQQCMSFDQQIWERKKKKTNS